MYVRSFHPISFHLISNGCFCRVSVAAWQVPSAGMPGTSAVANVSSGRARLKCSAGLVVVGIKAFWWCACVCVAWMLEMRHGFGVVLQFLVCCAAEVCNYVCRRAVGVLWVR